MIHPTAIVHPTAKIASDVSIGPWSVIGENVVIDHGTKIGAHVVINGPTILGKNNQIFQFSSLGEMPQDKKYQGEQTLLQIGDNNIIREFCTFNRGTIQDHGITAIGNNNLFMAYVHIAHDCKIGSNTIFANNASLAGHVQVGDYANLGAFVGVFQFCHIGQYSFIAGCSVVVKDIPPFLKVSGHYAKPYGLNSVGLKRNAFSQEVMLKLKRAYKIIYRQGLTVRQALIELSGAELHCAAVDQLASFIANSKYGIVR